VDQYFKLNMLEEEDKLDALVIALKDQALNGTNDGRSKTQR